MAEGIRASLSEVAAWVDGRVIGNDVAFKGVSTDSRAVAQGSLFIALKGERFDGHGFLAQAAAQGASAALVERPVEAALPQLVVADTRAALSRLATCWRRSGLPLIAVTGSNGKTTTKELLSAILAQDGAVLSTRGNLNNDLGVPLTLLRMEDQHRWAVVEMGANHPGEIAQLTRIATPQVSVITNAASAHLEGFGSLEGVALAKGEIYEGLGEDGTAVINADSSFFDLWRGIAGGRRVITFGFDNEAHISGTPGGPDGELLIRTPNGSVPVRFALLGRHNAMNALAAAAVAHAVGIGLDAIKAGLESARPVHGRLEVKPGREGACLIDDTYNANPASLRAGLEVLATRQGRRFLALGDMRELGGQGPSLHAEAGRVARELGVERLFATGDLSRFSVEEFGEGGEFFESQEQLIAALARELGPQVTVLVKGSRTQHMERVIQALAREEA